MRRHSLDRRRFVSALAGIARRMRTGVARRNRRRHRCRPPIGVRRSRRLRRDAPATAPDASRRTRSSRLRRPLCARRHRGSRARLRSRGNGPSPQRCARAVPALPLEPPSDEWNPAADGDRPGQLAARSEGLRVLRRASSAGGNERLLVPGGGADAPHRSLPLLDPTDVALGTHVFGAARRGPGSSRRHGATARRTRDSSPGAPCRAIGATAFDVDDDGIRPPPRRGAQARSALGPGRHGPSPVALSIDGRLADMALGDDGSIHVLESVAAPGERRSSAVSTPPDVRSAPSRRRSANLRSSGSAPNGPVVLQRPSQQWMPVAETNGPIEPRDQRGKAQSGTTASLGWRGRRAEARRRDPGRSRLERPGASARGESRARRHSPRSSSPSRSAAGSLLIVRAYTDAADEFVVLVLDRDGIVTEFCDADGRMGGGRSARAVPARRQPALPPRIRCVGSVRRPLRPRRRPDVGRRSFVVGLAVGIGLVTAGSAAAYHTRFVADNCNSAAPTPDVLHHPRRLGDGRAARAVRGIPMGGRLLERQRPRRLAERSA